jgi:hypothetical protein
MRKLEVYPMRNGPFWNTLGSRVTRDVHPMTDAESAPT